MDNVAFLRLHPRFLANEERRLAEARAMLRSGAPRARVKAKYGLDLYLYALALQYQEAGFPAGDTRALSAWNRFFPPHQVEEEP